MSDVVYLSPERWELLCQSYAEWLAVPPAAIVLTEPRKVDDILFLPATYRPKETPAST